MARRPKRMGSIYQRASDGLWLAVVEIGDVESRRRKVFSGKTREIVEAKLATWHQEHPPRPYLPEGSLARRRELREQPGAHTSAQWYAKVRATPDCPYCAVRLTFWNSQRDHLVPISRGGSDSIDNLTPCCSSCNRRKAHLTADEFRALLAGETVAAPREAAPDAT